MIRLGLRKIPGFFPVAQAVRGVIHKMHRDA